MRKQIIFFAILSLVACNPSFEELEEKRKKAAAEAAAKEKERAKQDSITAAEWPAKLKAMVAKEIEALDKPFDNSKYSGSADAVRAELALFDAWGVVVKTGEGADDEETKELAATLRDKVVKLQAKEYPEMRKRYAVVIANEFWEQDIEIKALGSKSTVLEFSGAIFAANKNIKEFQTKLSYMLTKLRFKQVRYQWYKGASEYTYYDLPSQDDKSL